MTDADDIARHAARTISLIAAKAAGFATRLFVATTVVCVGGFLLGVAALSDGIESVWIVLATVFGSIAIGSAFTALWRAGSVRRNAPQLVDEVRRLATEGRDTTRTVIETFAVDGDDPDGSAIVLSRQMSGFRGLAGSDLRSTPRMSAAVRALTTFPALVLGAAAISCVFAASSFLFLIALALG